MILRRLLIIFFALALGLLFFFPLIKGNVLYCCDNLLINIPSRIFLFSELSSNRFPLWNPYIFSGTSFVSDLNVSPFYPFIVIEFFLHKIASIYQVISISIVLHILFSFIGMYWCMRILRANVFASIVSAIIFSFSGTVMTYVNNIPMLQVVAYLPWGVAALFSYINKRTIVSFILLLVVLCLQLLAGHPQLTYYSWLLYGTIVFTFYEHRIWKKVVFISLLVLSVFCITAFQIFPFIESIVHSTRLNTVDSNAGALPFSSLFRFILPSVTGDIRNGTDWWQGGAVIGYVGVGALLLAMFGIAKSKYTIFFSAVAVVTFLAAFGNQTPIFSVARIIIPGISLFRVPAHFLLLYTFSISIVAGFGVTNVMKETLTVRRGSLLLISFIFLTSLFFFRNIVVEYAILFFSHSQKFLNKFDYLQIYGLEQIFTSVIINAFVIIIFLSIFLLVRKSFKPYILCIAIIFELFLYSRQAFITLPSTVIKKYEQSAQLTVKATQTQNRIFIHPSLYPAQSQKIFGVPSFPKEIEWQYTILRPNIASLWKNSYIDGYGSIINGSYQKYFGNTPTDPTGIYITSNNIDQMKSLNVDRILLPKGAACDKSCRIFDQFQTIGETEYILVKELQSNSPYASVTSQEEVKELIPTRRIPGYIAFNYFENKPGTLMLSESNAPGWHVFVNGVETSLSDQYLLSVQLPEYASHIVFIYRPYSFILGILVSVLFSIGLFLFVIFHVLRNPKIIKGKNYGKNGKETNKQYKY